MFSDKSYICMLLLCIQTLTASNIEFASTTTEVNGFFMNLSQNDKMSLIVGSLDHGLYLVFSDFQNDHNTQYLYNRLNIGIDRYMRMLFEINRDMHKSTMYLYFLEYASYICKYGKTAEFLATLSLQDRTNIINLAFQCWLESYTAHLIVNSGYMLDAINERFAVV